MMQNRQKSERFEAILVHSANHETPPYRCHALFSLCEKRTSAGSRPLIAEKRSFSPGYARWAMNNSALEIKPVFQENRF